MKSRTPLDAASECRPFSGKKMEWLRLSVPTLLQGIICHELWSAEQRMRDGRVSGWECMTVMRVGEGSLHIYEVRISDGLLWGQKLTSCLIAHSQVPIRIMEPMCKAKLSAAILSSALKFRQRVCLDSHLSSFVHMDKASKSPSLF